MPVIEDTLRKCLQNREFAQELLTLAKAKWRNVWKRERAKETTWFLAGIFGVD